MATLILHVGTSKAGSTAFQEFLAANRSPLGRDGVAYFPLLKGSNHSPLAAAFCTRSTPIGRSLGVTSAADRARLQRWLARRLSETVRPDSVWLASSEQFGTMLRQPAEVAALSAFLAQFFDRMLILAVLRRADYWLPSSYVESIRAGDTHALDAAFVHSRRRTLDAPKLLGKWEQAFRAESVRAVPFLESDKRDARLLPFRILGAAGLSPADPAAYGIPERLSNESISAYATEVLRLANPLLKTSRLRPVSSRRRAVLDVARRWPGPATALTPDAAEAIERSGWLRTGVEQSSWAFGDAWPAWASQPPARVSPQPVLTAEEQEAALAVLRQAGTVRPPRPSEDARSPLDVAATQARRLARRALRLF